MLLCSCNIAADSFYKNVVRILPQEKILRTVLSLLQLVYPVWLFYQFALLILQPDFFAYHLCKRYMTYIVIHDHEMSRHHLKDQIVSSNNRVVPDNLLRPDHILPL